MAHDVRARCIHHVQDVHGCVAHHFLGDVHQHAFTGKRGIERRETIARRRDGGAEEARQQFRLVDGGLGQRHHAHPVRQRAERRERCAEATIHEHDERPGPTKGVRCERRNIHRAGRRTIGRHVELCRRDGRHIGVVPVFFTRGRETQRLERLGARRPQRFERTWRVSHRSGNRLFGETKPGAHAAVSRTQS